MSSDEAQRIVQIGLDRRKEDRDTAAKEARLEKYEQDQIHFCNEHCANAKEQRQLEETGRRNMQQYEARRAARQQALALELAREQAAMRSGKNENQRQSKIESETSFERRYWNRRRFKS